MQNDQVKYFCQKIQQSMLKICMYDSIQKNCVQRFSLSTIVIYV